MKKKIWMACVAALLIPYVTTLAWTGTIEGKEISSDWDSGRTVILDRGEYQSVMDAEEYLVGITARQIAPGYEPEALKAQAIIARTYLYRQMGEEKEIAESALDLDYLETSQMEKLWGKEKYIAYYRKIEQAVKETKGLTIQYEGDYIDPLFHKVSAGRTRAGDELHPYLQSVDCGRDVEADSYLTLFTWNKDDFAARIRELPDPPQIHGENVPQSLQLVEKDEAGYVKKMQVGEKTYTGEEIQYTLKLPSACFAFEELEGKVRVVCKGIGHGYGFDQFDANKRAAKGWKAEELLKFYYKGITVVSDSL